MEFSSASLVLYYFLLYTSFFQVVIFLLWIWGLCEVCCCICILYYLSISLKYVDHNSLSWLKIFGSHSAFIGLKYLDPRAPHSWLLEELLDHGVWFDLCCSLATWQPETLNVSEYSYQLLIFKLWCTTSAVTAIVSHLPHCGFDSWPFWQDPSGFCSVFEFVSWNYFPSGGAFSKRLLLAPFSSMVPTVQDANAVSSYYLRRPPRVALTLSFLSYAPDFLWPYTG